MASPKLRNEFCVQVIVQVNVCCSL